VDGPQGMVALPLPMIFANAVTADGTMVAGGDHWWNTSGQTGTFGHFLAGKNNPMRWPFPVTARWLWAQPLAKDAPRLRLTGGERVHR
jgi:hypothetical protein